jgi:hypothetical protein
VISPVASAIALLVAWLPLLGSRQTERVDGTVLVVRDAVSDVCHAVLVGPQTAITAAHCVHGTSRSRISLLAMNGRQLEAVRVDLGGGRRLPHPAEDVTSLQLVAPTELPVFEFAGGDAAPVTLLRVVSDRRNGRRVEETSLDHHVRDGLLTFAWPAVCAGDSGAPALDEERRLVALVVGVTATGCGSGLTVLASVRGPIARIHPTSEATRFSSRAFTGHLASKED